MSERDENEFPKVISYAQYLEQQERAEAEAAPPRPVQAAAPAVNAAPEPVKPPRPAAPVISEAELLSHNYDGIQEYDNPTPGWWYMIFAATVGFSVLYILIYQLGGLVPTPIQRHDAMQAAALELRFAGLGDIPMGEEKILQIMNEPAWLAQGESIFAATCAVCHQADGRGSVGPNLTDDLYKNIKVLMDIPALVLNGAGNGAMPAQKNTLNENEIALVAAYAASLRGKNLPTGDTVRAELTGVPIDPWPTEADDSSGGADPSS